MNQFKKMEMKVSGSHYKEINGKPVIDEKIGLEYDKSAQDEKLNAMVQKDRKKTSASFDHLEDFLTAFKRNNNSIVKTVKEEAKEKGKRKEKGKKRTKTKTKIKTNAINRAMSKKTRKNREKIRRKKRDDIMDL